METPQVLEGLPRISSYPRFWLRHLDPGAFHTFASKAALLDASIRNTVEPDRWGVVDHHSANCQFPITCVGVPCGGREHSGVDAVFGLVYFGNCLLSRL